MTRSSSASVTNLMPETSVPTTALSKRRHDEFRRDRAPVVDGYEMPPQKRVRGDKPNGILKKARSATRSLHKPAARIPGSRPILNPSGRCAEGRGSRPRVRKDFTIDPCWAKSPAGVGGRSRGRTADLGRGECGRNVHRTNSIVQQ